MFSRADFTAMAEQLGRITGRFILSLNDVPEVREIFASFELTSIQTTYSGGKTERTRAAHVPSF